MVLTLILALGGCGTAANKQYVVPENEDIQECVSSCRQTKLDCRARGLDQRKACTTEYEYQKRDYEYCVRSGNKACFVPASCPMPDSRPCTRQYDGCFQACGGEIHTKEKSKR
jgi:hypothetical protein